MSLTGVSGTPDNKKCIHHSPQRSEVDQQKHIIAILAFDTKKKKHNRHAVPERKLSRRERERKEAGQIRNNNKKKNTYYPTPLIFHCVLFRLQFLKSIAKKGYYER